MPLSIIAQKLLKYLKIYHIRPTVLNARLGGTLDQYYNRNWFADNQITTSPRIRASAQKGLFSTALAELVTGGY